MIERRFDFALLLGSIDRLEALAQMLPAQGELAQHLLAHGRTGRQQQPALAAEMAVDLFALHRFADGAKGVVQFAIRLRGEIQAVRVDQFAKSLLKSAPDIAGIARTGALPGNARIDHSDVAAGARQMEGGDEPGDSGADDGDVG